MPTLYRPVLIESAEQAEALPSGSIVTAEDKDGPWEKYPDGKFKGADRTVVDAYYVLDRIALVPIEAEEVRVIASGGLERDYHGATVLNHAPDGPRRDYRRTEFHTPWEEA